MYDTLYNQTPLYMQNVFSGRKLPSDNIQNLENISQVFKPRTDYMKRNSGYFGYPLKQTSIGATSAFIPGVLQKGPR